MLTSILHSSDGLGILAVMGVFEALQGRCNMGDLSMNSSDLADIHQRELYSYGLDVGLGMDPLGRRHWFRRFGTGNVM
jgi:hypothetical protein